MAGYSDTRKLIIDTLMGRPAGTEIQPEEHQAFALALNDYIRNVELNSGNAFIGFAQSDTVPIQSNNGQCFYISTVPPGTNIVYANFIDYEGNPISVTTSPNKMAFVTLIWNTRNWDAQITIIETNWSQIFENNIAPNSIDSSKIIDGTIQSTDLNPNAFDNTLTKPDKIAPADVVGSELTELLNYINGMEGGVNGFAEDTSFQPNYPEDVAATVIGVGPGTFTNMIGENGSAITVDSISVVIFFKAAGSTYWKYKTILPTVVIEGDVMLGVKDYAQLQGKPSINGKELASGDNTLDALGIQPKGDYATEAAVNTIQALIPATATADNQLADKDFVNSSIATATAEFKGSFTSLDELKATSGNLNDYAFYLHTDNIGNKVVDRYKWTTAGWLYEYTLNNSSFTAEQWAALNSAITATLVQSYNSHLNNSTIHITTEERSAWNAKWDYNEETIKGVKVNAAILSDKATKLATARKIWGKRFDGSDDVSGDLIDVGNITASGKATIQGDIVCGGEVASIVGEGTPAGVTDYSALTGKPQINGKELTSGDNTLAELGIQPAGDYITESLLNTKLDNYTTKTFVSNNYAGKSALNDHIADSIRHITDAERTAWNNKSDLTAEDVKGIKVNNAGHADSADNATKAGSADKLTNSHKIFGLPFDGTKDVDGGITANGDSVIKGNLNVTKDGIFGGEVSGIVGEGTPAGVTDYSALTGKPSINGVTLVSGNNTLAALGIQAAGDYATNSGVTTLLANYADKTFVANNYAGKAAFNSHTADTDIHITAAERAAWNAKWDYNENTIKAVKVTAASSADSVAWKGIKDKPTTFTPSAHTHTASEISGLPTKLSAFTNDVGYITGITKSMVEGVLTGNITSHTHTFASLTSKPTTLSGYGITDAYTSSTIDSKLSGYLPLIGGTLNVGYGSLIIEGQGDDKLIFNNTDGEKYQRIVFKDANTEYGSILVSDIGVIIATPKLTVNEANVLHSGNYNSYAPTLTGTGASGTWGISISGNAASATKLATARTIWGQSFDGSENVSGAINGVPYLNSGDEIGDFYIGDRNAGLGVKDKGLLFYVYSARPMSFYTGSTSRIEIASNGNVGIGTTSPQYKLDVNGNGHFASKLTVDDDIVCGGEVSALVA